MRRSSFFALALLFAGCTQILDIEDPEFDGGSAPVSDGGIASMDSGVTEACGRYCVLAESICGKDSGQQQYTSPDYCNAVCAKLPRGAAANANTLDCRLALMEEANPSPEKLTYCQAGGPMGTEGLNGAGKACGTTCESYCNLRREVCSDQPITDCLNRCDALLDTKFFQAESDFGSSADTLQCRLAHLSTAANHLRVAEKAARDGDDVTRMSNDTSRMTHCFHSGIKSINPMMNFTVFGNGPCDDGTKDMKPLETRCDGYCRLVDRACKGSNRVYENEGQCLKVCEALPKGTQATAQENNIRCRKTSAYAALEDLVSPARKCSTASPASAECGGRTSKCESYCTLAKAGCGNAFTTTFPTMDACLTTCAGLRDATVEDFLYPATTSGPTVDCRIHYAMLAISGDTSPATCASVFGGANCVP